MPAHRYGWIPDLPDQRDHFYLAPPPPPGGYPAVISLMPQAPPVRDQGQLGSCTGFGSTEGLNYTLAKLGKPQQPFAPLFQYYNTRVIEGTVKQDAGGSIRDAIKAAAKYGVCLESDWPYAIAKFASKPPATAYQSAVKHELLQYAQVAQTLSQIQACLFAGFPIVLGFSVYESFESDAVAKSGNAPLPAKSESLLGGHCVALCGINTGTAALPLNGKSWPAGTFLLQNSWGAGWGMAGFFSLPIAYLTDPNLASDFWTMRMVEA